MADIDVSQGRLYSTLFDETTTASLRVSLGNVLAAINFPAENIHASQAFVQVVGTGITTMFVNQARTYAVGNNRQDNRIVRAFPFKLDGHQMYVIRLGNDSTLVYDLTTGQWAEWSSPNLPFWRLNCGMNWLGMPAAAVDEGHTTNVLCGDDVAGLLWTLKPEQGYDEGTRTTVPSRSFTRRVVGGIPMKMRETQKVGAAYLTADIGSPSLTGANISLRTSDDNGKTWQEHGTITAEPENYDQEYVWRSIGLIKAPGRIFEITDDGATVRIDGLDIR